MRKLLAIATLLLLFVASCTDDWRYCTMTGRGVAAEDTLYLYGLDKRYEYVDTIIADEAGEFEYEIPIDTVTPMGLLMPSGCNMVLFAEPDGKIEIQPDSLHNGKWSIRGGVLQQKYDSMVALLAPLGALKRATEVERFVEHNPLNEVGIVLVRRYLVEATSPAKRNIQDIMNKFGGRLQDNDYIVEYKEEMQQKRSISNVLYSSVPVFDYTEMDDTTKLNNKRYREKYWVINFWASWDTISLNHMREMSRVSKKFAPEDFTMLNISLDHDTAAWRKAVMADSITGDNVCDRKMWNNTLVKRYDVDRLPYSVLVDPQLSNCRYNVKAEKFESQLDSIINEHKEKKAKAKSKNRNNKR